MHLYQNHFKVKASQHYSIIIFLFLSTRVLYKLFSGKNNFELFGDSRRYDKFSDLILSGHFDLDIGSFILAPIYPYFLAGCKLMSSENWEWIAVSIQFLMVSISGIYLYKLSLLLFNNADLAFLTSLVYCFFPMTFYYNFNLSQETLFQSFLIIAIYHFVKGANNDLRKNILLSALLFGLCLHIKSHVNLLWPLLAFLLFFEQKHKSAIVFILLILITTLPYGIYNLKQNGVYTVGSNGFATMFYFGHNDCVYYDTVNSQKQCPEWVFDKGFIHPTLGKINTGNHVDQSTNYLRAGVQWIKENPGKFFYLKLVTIYRFFMPGVSYNHFSPNLFWSSLLISLPIYLFAIWGLLSIKLFDVRFIWPIILSILALYLISVPQSRFRSITLEPFLIIIACYSFSLLFEKWKKKSPTIAVLIVTHNGVNTIKSCINSVVKSDYQNDIFVLDNCSSDGTQEVLRSFKEVQLIENKINIGFGQANNILLKNIFGAYDYYFLINQDVILQENTITELVSSNINSGILCPLHLDEENNIDPDFLYFLSNSNFDLSSQSPRTIPFASAAAWFIPHSTVQQVGGFDPLFFYTKEDLDYAQRLHFFGLDFSLIPVAKIAHLHNSYTERNTSFAIRKSHEADVLARLKDISVSFIKGLISGLLYLIRTSFYKKGKHPGFFFFQNIQLSIFVFSNISKIKNHRQISISDETAFLNN